LAKFVGVTGGDVGPSLSAIDVKVRMSCTSNELLFAVALLAFVLAALHSEWHSNALMKILELRHSATYDSLGRPSPWRTSESDKHSFAMQRFVMSETHASLGDAQLTRAIKSLRFSFAVNLIATLMIVACLIAAPDAKGLVTFVCWGK
jgi:hypothetical protein